MESPEVVISGIAGNFPACENIRTFFESLDNERCLITTDHGRWKKGLYGMEGHLAVSNKLGLLDNVFFGLHRTLSIVTSPTTRTVIEKSFEAIIDAGINPRDVFGTNAQVVMNAYDPEQEAMFLDTRAVTMGVVGSSKTMTANRVSYFFGFTGKSCTFTSSGIWLSQALEISLAAITSGECDMVIVGGGTGNKHPEYSLAAASMDYMSPDGVPRPFDAEGNGTVRSDVQLVFVLQRADMAKRAYATVVGAIGRPADPRFGNITTPSAVRAKQVIQELYTKCRVDPALVQYVECNGCGYPPSDVAELDAIAEVLTPNRKKPLPVGSLQGTVGLSEHAAGLVSAVKVIRIMETGIIPPTANHKIPHPAIESLAKGTVKVVTERTEIDIEENQYFAVSELGIVGDVGHTLLRVSAKKKKNWDLNEEIPRLIFFSLRSDADAERITNEIANAPFDPEYFSLINDVFRLRIRGYPLKGYTICPTPENFKPQVIIDNHQERPVWFVFSGMGSQWPGMGRDLMRIPEFMKTIQRCHEALEPKGLNLIDILTTSDESIFDNILHSFVGIAAVQIGLVKLLRLIGINPTGFVGHSVGEQACAFMDDCINEQQTILCAYARGKASNETTLIPGMMAAIGLGYNNIKDRVPATIDVACRNSSDSCTISGPREDVENFVEELKAEKIFARTVNVANIAYHSRYIKDVAPYLLKRLREIITHPKKRSARWISTSVPEEEWESEEAQFCSAQYLTNNLLNSVLFEEGLRHIPENAILIEIAPHGLLQSILRKSGPKDSVSIPLTARNSNDGLSFFFNAIGRLYLEGLTPDISRIYPPVTYPVSRGTPTLQTLLSWSYVHDDNFIRQSYDNLGERTVKINMITPHDNIRGVKYCAASNILVQLWLCLADIHKFQVNALPLIFKNLCFAAPLEIPVKATLNLQPGVTLASRSFEVRTEYRSVLKGSALVEWDDDELKYKPQPPPLSKKVRLNGDQVYSELAIRGQSYSSSLKKIQYIEITDTEWTVRTCHNNDWNILLSTALQAVQLYETDRTHNCTYPWKIRKLVIHPEKILAANSQEATLVFQPKTGVVHSEGLLIAGIEMRQILSSPLNPQIEISVAKFIAHGTKEEQSKDVITRLAVQLVAELQPLSTSIPLIHLKGSSDQSEIDVGDLKRCAETFGIKLELMEYQTNGRSLPTNLTTNSFLGLVICGVGAAASAVSLAKSADVVLMIKVPRDTAYPPAVAELAVVAQGNDSDGRILLLRAAKSIQSTFKVVQMECTVPIENFDEKIQAGSVFVWDSEPYEGVKSAVDKFFNNFDRAMARLVFILDPTAPQFSLDLPFYKSQLALGWRVNIYKGGAWGTLQHASLPADIGQLSRSEDDVLTAMSLRSVGDLTIKYWGINERNAVKGRGTMYVLDYSGADYDNKEFIGVAYTQLLNSNLDMRLRWPLPEGWSAEDGATVPVAYSMAFYSLKVLAEITSRSKVLITDATTPEGQALVNVALGLGGQVFACVPKEHEADFKNIPPIGGNKLNVFIGKNPETFRKIKVCCRGGVDILASVGPNDLDSLAAAMVASEGKILHFGGLDPSGITKLGMFPFIISVGAYGVNVERLLIMRDEDREVVASLMKEGLKPGGIVRPLRRTVLPQSLGIPWSEGWIRSQKVLNRVKYSKNIYLGGFGAAVIVAGTTYENSLLTRWFINRGTTNIVEVENEQSDFPQRKTREIGTSVFTVSDIDSAIQRASSLGRLAVAIIVAQTTMDTEELIRQLELFKNKKDVTVLVFLRDHSIRGTIVKACEGLRSEKGFRTVLTSGTVEAAVSTKLMDWLLRSDEDPKVVHIREANADIVPKMPCADLLDKLPSDGDTLGALYKLMTSRPIIHELPTLSPRYSLAREIFPLFALPSFGGVGLNVLKPLADRLYAPLFAVQLPNTVTNIKDVAREIAAEIRKISPRGPYAVLGSDWTAAISHQVALELRKARETVLLFLLDADLNVQLREVKEMNERSDLDVLLIKRILGTKASPEVLFRIASLSSWAERVKAASSLLASNEDSCTSAACCLNLIHDIILMLAEHTLEADDLDTFMLRSGQACYTEYEQSKNRMFYGVVEPYREVFSSKMLTDFINDNMTRPGMKTKASEIAEVKL